MAHQSNSPAADFSIPSSNETQNSGIDGAGNAASSLTHWNNLETSPPPQLPDPANPLTGNHDSGLRDTLHNGIDVRPPYPLLVPNPFSFGFNNSPLALSSPENSLTTPLPPSTNYYPETSSYDNLSLIYPRLQHERVDDLYNSTGLPPRQTGMEQNAPPVLPSIAHGFWERFVNALPWLISGTERDGVALINGIAHQFGLQNPIAHAPLPVCRVSSQPFPNSSTIHPAPTLHEDGGTGIGMSSAQMNNSYPVHIAEQRPVSWVPQSFPTSSTTHLTTDRSEFDGPMNGLSSSLYESSSTSPHGNYGLQPSSSTPPSTHGASPALHGSTSRLSRMLVPNSPAKISPTLPAIPYCEPGHELQLYKREHDTNPSPSTEGAFGLGAPFGQYHAAGYGQFSAGQTGAANTGHMASNKRAFKKRASRKVPKPGLCSQCPVTESSQWRRDPDNNDQLCNACGQKARSKKRNKNKNKN